MGGVFLSDEGVGGEGVKPSDFFDNCIWSLRPM